MPTRIVFETHSITEDNESGHATGWQPGRLSAAGRELARQRECDYGERNGAPSADLERRGHVDTPYPGGESWRQAAARVARFLPDLSLRWDGARVCVIGHSATRWAFEHVLHGVALEQLLSEEFAWQEGWEYTLG